jgi:hypothetical protein
MNWIGAARIAGGKPANTAEKGVGAFLGSGEDGVRLVPAFEAWLGGTKMTVGRTYLSGESWTTIEGDPGIIGPWAAWLKQQPGRALAINVPMAAPNEANLPDDAVRDLLGAGAQGAFDSHYGKLAAALVDAGAPGAIIVLGWEMNGITFTGRCAPDPATWKQYWRRIVTVMRAQPGQRFTFDFAPNRGPEAVPWSDCYPGDDVVDIIGMDSYDQPPGHTFKDYIDQPYGLRFQADFATKHGKRMSFPEWGLFRNGDNPEYVRDMLGWIAAHDVAYHSITDYCPHGVWSCEADPDSSQAYRELLGAPPGPQ